MLTTTANLKLPTWESSLFGAERKSICLVAFQKQIVDTVVMTMTRAPSGSVSSYYRP